jgi:hypothetical protein
VTPRGGDGPLRRAGGALLCLAVLGPACGCGVPAADRPGDSFGLDFAMPQEARVRGAIVFVVDGLNARIFHEMLTAGELPACQRFLVDRGLYVPRAVGNTPSVTLANLTSLVTGLFPGHHGVTGINWFDRNQLIWRNYETIAQKNTLDGDYTAANIYEQFPDETTFSVFFQPHRGTTKFIENWTSAGPPFFFGWYEFVDRLTLSRFDIVVDVARRRGAWPAVTIAYLLSPDFRAYEHGVESAQYRQAIRQTDRQIGRVLADLERAGLLDRLIIALVSDHGLGEVSRHFCLENFLTDRVGLDVASARLWEQTPFESRLAYYRRFSTVLYGSGDRYWAICLRRPVRREGRVTGFAPWPVRPTADDLAHYPAMRRGAAQRDLPALLVQQEAVDAVAYAAGADRVRIRRRSGEVEFHQPGGRGGPIIYHVIAGGDPLGWSAHVPGELLGGKAATPRQWLRATCTTNYPDLPAQILAYFRARRGGDIAVFAACGWDFLNKNRAGHGGLHGEDLLVPLAVAGPGVPRGTIDAARTADLMPTILQLLGRPLPPNLDGESLLRPQ